MKTSPRRSLKGGRGARSGRAGQTNARGSRFHDCFNQEPFLWRPATTTALGSWTSFCVRARLPVWRRQIGPLVCWHRTSSGRDACGRGQRGAGAAQSHSTPPVPGFLWPPAQRPGLFEVTPAKHSRDRIQQRTRTSKHNLRAAHSPSSQHPRQRQRLVLVRRVREEFVGLACEARGTGSDLLQTH